MAVSITVHYHKSILSLKSPDETFKYFANFENAIPANFPGLESFKKLESERYHWRFKKLSFAGQTIEIEFTTSFVCKPSSSISIVPVDTPKGSKLDGVWAFEPNASGCRITFSVTLSLALSFPSLFGSIVKSMAEQQVQSFFDRYMINVESALS